MGREVRARAYLPSLAQTHKIICSCGESPLSQHVVVSQNKGTPDRPQYIIVLNIGNPKKVPLILGNPHVRVFLGR